MDFYIDEFQSYLSDEKHASKNTVESYLRDIKQYLSYLSLTEESQLENTNTKNVEDFVSELKSCGKSTATVTRITASIRAYYQFLISIGAVSSNPAKGVKLERNERKMPEILNEEEIKLLLSAPNDKDYKGMRDKSMLELMYATGLRVSELVNLDVGDFRSYHTAKGDKGQIICHGAKGERTIPMHDKAYTALVNYLENARPMLSCPSTGDALFINMNGSRLTRQGFWKIIKSYSEATDINKDITPHTLRHSFALHLYQNGASLKDLQCMLGHVDISSTQLYAMVSGMNSSEEVYNRCHPRAAHVQSDT